MLCMNLNMAVLDEVVFVRTSSVIFKNWQDGNWLSWRIYLKTATPGDNLWSKVLTYNPPTRRRKRHVTADDVTVTFWQRAIYIVYKLSLNFPSFKAIAGCQLDSSSSKTACQHTAYNTAQRTELAAGQLSRFHHKRPMASKFTEHKPSGLSCVGCNAGSIPQAQIKAENKHQTQGSTSDYLGQPATGTDRQGCERFVK